MVCEVALECSFLMTITTHSIRCQILNFCISILIAIVHIVSPSVLKVGINTHPYLSDTFLSLLNSNYLNINLPCKLITDF